MQHFKSDERFVPVPLSLIQDPTLSAYHIATYTVIRSHSDFGKETGSFVSDRRGAELAGISERKFRECRNALRDAGWLEWTGREGRQNHYIVRSKQSAPPDGQASTPAPQTGVGTSTPAHRADLPRHDMPTPPAHGADYLEPVTETSATESSGSSKELPAGEIEDAFTANDLLTIVVKIGLRGQRPAPWGKHSRHAQVLIDEYGLDCEAVVYEACRGIQLMFPWAPPPVGRRTPFDVFDLGRHLVKALSAAQDDKPPSDIVERQGSPARQDLARRGGAPVSLGSLVEGVLERARERKAS